MRFYEEPPTERMRWRPRGRTCGWRPTTGPTRSTHRTPDPANEARDPIWEELVTIILDKHDERRSPRTSSAGRCGPNEELRTTFERGVAAHRRDGPGGRPVVGARLPAAVRSVAHPEEVRALQREDAQAWTVSDLPLLDAARQRLGDPEARTSAPAGGRPRRRARGDDQGRRPPDRRRRLRDARDVDAARQDLQERPGRRDRGCPAPTRTCSPAHSRTSSWTRRRS